MLPYSDFFKERKENIKPLNSNLLVNIDRFGVGLSNEKVWSFDRFTFTAYSGFGYYQKGECKCSNELSKSYSVIKGNEKEFFKKIFIEIEDCPEWSKEALYQIREKELNSIKRKVLKLFK